MLKQGSCHKTIRLHGIVAKMCLCRVVAKLRKRKGLTVKCICQSPYLLDDQCMASCHCPGAVRRASAIPHPHRIGWLLRFRAIPCSGVSFT